MATIQAAQVERKREVVDDARPKRRRHGEGGRLAKRELFECEKRLRRKDERPDLLQVAVGETKRLHHGRKLVIWIFGAAGRGWWFAAEGRRERAGALPKGRLGFD